MAVGLLLSAIWLGMGGIIVALVPLSDGTAPRLVVALTFLLVAALSAWVLRVYYRRRPSFERLPLMKRALLTIAGWSPLAAFVVLGIFFCGYLISGLLSNPVTVTFYCFYLVAGLAVYFGYSQFHSRLRRDAVLVSEPLAAADCVIENREGMKP